jgi:hypothetical protein
MTMAAHITTILIGIALGATVSIDRLADLVWHIRKGGRP